MPLFQVRYHGHSFFTGVIRRHSRYALISFPACHAAIVLSVLSKSSWDFWGGNVPAIATGNPDLAGRFRPGSSALWRGRRRHLARPILSPSALETTPAQTAPSDGLLFVSIGLCLDLKCVPRPPMLCYMLTCVGISSIAEYKISSMILRIISSVLGPCTYWLRQY